VDFVARPVPSRGAVNDRKSSLQDAAPHVAYVDMVDTTTRAARDDKRSQIAELSGCASARFRHLG
jgi:hypothetical protein